MNNRSVTTIVQPKINPMNDGDRFDRVVRQIVGKRITWDKLTRKTPNLETNLN
jgi:hypothetical protein